MDDSNTSFLRSLSIKYALKIKNTFLIIHDFENFIYKNSVKDFNNTTIIKSLTPQTAILYNGHEKLLLEKIVKTISYYSNQIDVNDFQGWKKVLQKRNLVK